MANLTFSQLETLWQQAGGSPKLAPTMAAVALAESGGDPNSVNNDPSTGDYSVGLWQVNYFGDLYAERSQLFGPPAELTDPAKNAAAAVEIAGPNGQGLDNWTTYSSGAYQQYLNGKAPASPGTAPGQATLTSAQTGSPSIPANPLVRIGLIVGGGILGIIALLGAFGVLAGGGDVAAAAEATALPATAVVDARRRSQRASRAERGLQVREAASARAQATHERRERESGEIAEISQFSKEETKRNREYKAQSKGSIEPTRPRSESTQEKRERLSKGQAEAKRQAEAEI